MPLERRVLWPKSCSPNLPLSDTQSAHPISGLPKVIALPIITIVKKQKKPQDQIRCHFQPIFTKSSDHLPLHDYVPPSPLPSIPPPNRLPPRAPSIKSSPIPPLLTRQIKISSQKLVSSHAYARNQMHRSVLYFAVCSSISSWVSCQSQCPPSIRPLISAHVCVCICVAKSMLGVSFILSFVLSLVDRSFVRSVVRSICLFVGSFAIVCPCSIR